MTLLRQLFLATDGTAATPGGYGFSESLAVPIGGFASLSLTPYIPSTPDTAGVPAVLLVNAGTTAVAVRFWTAANGAFPNNVAGAPNLYVPAASQQVVPIKAPIDTLILTCLGLGTIVGVIGGHVVRAFDAGAIDVTLAQRAS